MVLEFQLPEAGLRICLWTYVHVMDAEKHQPCLRTSLRPPQYALTSKRPVQGRWGDGVGVHWVPWKKSSVEAQSCGDDVCENLALSD